MVSENTIKRHTRKDQSSQRTCQAKVDLTACSNQTFCWIVCDYAYKIQSYFCRKTSLSLVFLQIAMDKGKKIMINNNGGHAGRGCNNNSAMTSDAFNNQSKLKILLCDSDPESCDEISTLLTKCSYQGLLLSMYLILLYHYLQCSLFLMARFCKFILLLSLSPCKYPAQLLQLTIACT